MQVFGLSISTQRFPKNKKPKVFFGLIPRKHLKPILLVVPGAFSQLFCWFFRQRNNNKKIAFVDLVVVLKFLKQANAQTRAIPIEMFYIAGQIQLKWESPWGWRAAGFYPRRSQLSRTGINICITTRCDRASAGNPHNGLFFLWNSEGGTFTEDIAKKKKFIWVLLWYFLSQHPDRLRPEVPSLLSAAWHVLVFCNRDTNLCS